MAHLDLGNVVLRRMTEEDIEAVKALIKVCFFFPSLGLSMEILTVFT